ncbi:MAG TPA: PKD domain-containing protein [Chitinophagaceae bacterium]|nr:PKD domain-containing protein [Chitinophagaceae bacterium]
MKKIYFLFVFTAILFLKVTAQDAANFTYTISAAERIVHFTNTSTLTGDVVRKAVWSFGDGQAAETAPKAGIDHQYSTAGTYTVCLKVYKRINDEFVLSSQECKQLVLSAVTTATCKADFSTESINGAPLVKRFAALPLQSEGKRPTKICWKFGDGKTECKEYTTVSSNNYSIEHAYAAAGQYEVCVTILYDGGCEAKVCKLVSITTPPPATCETKITEGATSVSNLKRTFYASLMANRVAEKICWTYGDGKESCTQLTNPLEQQSLITTHEYSAPGVYRVCAKVLYAGGCIAEYCREVVIRATTNTCGGYMTDSLSELKTVLFKGFGIQNGNDRVISYRWTFGDGITGNGQQVKHTYTTTGSYNVCLTMVTDAGCETRICKKVIVAGSNEPNLILTPNPVVAELHFSFHSTRQENITITIYNANGIAVKTVQRNVVAGQNTWGLDVRSLPTGIYSVTLRSPYQMATALFTKQ